MNTSYYLALQRNLRTGDVLKSPITAVNWTQHYALFWGYHEGHAWVVENLWDRGVVFTRFDNYLARVERINEIIHYRGADQDRLTIKHRANACIGQPYHRWNNNCEHLVNWVLYGHHYSAQAETVKTILGGLAVASLLVLVVRAAR